MDGVLGGVPFLINDLGEYEAALIRLAAELEQALPWRNRRPPMFAS